MPTSRQLGDPSQNFTVPDNTPAGMRIPEFAIRQLIGWALQNIRSTIDTPKNLVDALFPMVPDEVRAEIKTWVRKTTNIYLDVAWPRDDTSLPLIVVEPQSEQEDTSNALIGDMGGMVATDRFDGTPAGSPLFSIPERRTTHVYLATDDDRTTLFLYEMVKFILLSNKDGLTKWYDIHNLSIGGQVLEYDDKLHPIFGYYRVLTAQYLCFFDFSGPAEAASLVSLDGLFASTFNDGVEVDTPVPPDE